MGSKSIMFVAFVLAMAVLISSQVAAQWNDPTQQPLTPNDPPSTGGLCRHGCCGRSSHTRGCICCTRPGQRPSTPQNPSRRPPPGTKG